MEYSAAYVREYLPGEDPPFEQVPGDVVREIARWRDYAEFEDREMTARATRWTYAVFSELGLGRVRLERSFRRYWPEEVWAAGAVLANNFERVSFGLFDKETEEEGLGIIIDVPQWPGPNFVVVDDAAFPRLNNQKFPVAIRQSEIDLHADHPANATSACWAECNQNPGTWGILTAGHAIGSSRAGTSVAMANGTSGALVRSYYQPVDAAFVGTTSAPVAPSKLNVLSFPAPSMPATIHCQSGNKSKTIVEVTNNCGVLHTRGIGIMIYLDTPEQPGDSGALVTVNNRDAVGIYKASMKVPGGPGGVRAVAQNFEQAIYALDVTPYL